MAAEYDERGRWKFGFIPEFSDCIARIASVWARLEYDVNVIIWKLADVRPALGACITSQVYVFNARLSALLALAKLRRVDEAIIRKLNKFSNDVRAGQERRNRTVHDLWLNDSMHPEHMGRMRITADKTLNFRIESVPLLELVDDLHVVEDLATEFKAIRTAIEAALPTLPEIPNTELHPIVETNL